MDRGIGQKEARNFPLRKTYQFFLLIENKKLTKIVSLTGNDLETSWLLYSAMFCTNQKNAFLKCKVMNISLNTKAIVRNEKK